MRLIAILLLLVSSFVGAGIDQSWSPMILGDKDGNPIPGASASTAKHYVLEKGANIGAGDYTVIVSGVVVGKFTIKPNCVAPDPDPTPDPTPAEPPTTTGIPFGDVAALQAIGLLPVYSETTTNIGPDTSIVWNGTAGERDEIGLMPAQHAAFVAGQVDLLPSIVAVAKQPPASNISHGHKPNLYWLPFLMTGDVQYVRNMEQTYTLFRQWRSRGLVDSWMQGRNLAWTLRDLAQLAWLEENGFTEKTGYAADLEAARLEYITRQDHRFYDMWRVLGFNWVDSTSLGWTSWMESFVGQSLAHTTRLHSEWKPIAEWHFQHLVRRSGSEWPLKAVDADHVFFRWFCEGKPLNACSYDLQWNQVTPYQPTHTGTEDYTAYPDDQLLPYKLNGHRFTFANRAQYAYGWAVGAASIGITGAREKALQLKAAITERGDDFEIKNNFKVPE